NYTPPETAAPAFHHADSAVVEQKPIEAAWWTQFGDPTLDSLIERALGGDLDLKVAAARVQESRALLSAARRERWPGVDVAAAHSKTKAQQPGFTTDRIAIESNQVAIATRRCSSRPKSRARISTCAARRSGSRSRGRTRNLSAKL